MRGCSRSLGDLCCEWESFFKLQGAPSMDHGLLSRSALDLDRRARSRSVLDLDHGLYLDHGLLSGSALDLDRRARSRSVPNLDHGLWLYLDHGLLSGSALDLDRRARSRSVLRRRARSLWSVPDHGGSLYGLLQTQLLWERASSWSWPCLRCQCRWTAQCRVPGSHAQCVHEIVSMS